MGPERREMPVSVASQHQQAVEEFLQPLSRNIVFEDLWEPDQGLDAALGRRLRPTWITTAIRLVEEDGRPSEGEKACLAFTLWLHGYRTQERPDRRWDYFWTAVDTQWKSRMATLFRKVVTS